MAHEESKLFSPLKIGEKTVKNRMVVAPMSRHRAALSGVPTELNVEYYRQRASAGLIVTEGTAPSATRTEEPTSGLQSLMRIPYAGFCFKNRRCNKHYPNRKT